jgi:hypothetical protein
MNALSQVFPALFATFSRPAAVRPEPAAATEERRWGCGWFDSSHDLQRGLQLQELSNPDELAAELPLAFWLQIDLAGRAAIVPG